MYVCINYKPGNGIKMLCGAKKKKRIEFSILKWHASLLEMPGL